MLQYVLPAGMELHGATVFFSQFGEVLSLGLVPGDKLILAVTFYDVRSVPAALAALKGELCWPMPKQGDFMAKVPGRWSITPKDMACIADMRVDPQDEQSYLIEFFDRRDAAHMRQVLEAWGLPDSSSKDRPARPVPALVEAACASNEFECIHHEASRDEPVYLVPPSSPTGWLAWVPPAGELVLPATSSCSRSECTYIQPRGRALSPGSFAEESTEAPTSSDAGEEAADC